MSESYAERFWSKVEITEACWNWVAGRGGGGYGKFKIQGRDVYAHRVSYELAHGTIPPGLDLDHLCRNRACVNPSHLEAVSRRENILRGVGYTAQQARKTHCKAGHPFDSENTYAWRGGRICRACRRDYGRARQREGVCS